MELVGEVEYYFGEYLQDWVKPYLDKIAPEESHKEALEWVDAWSDDPFYDCEMLFEYVGVPEEVDPSERNSSKYEKWDIVFKEEDMCVFETDKYMLRTGK